MQGYRALGIGKSALNRASVKDVSYKTLHASAVTRFFMLGGFPLCRNFVTPNESNPSAEGHLSKSNFMLLKFIPLLPNAL